MTITSHRETQHAGTASSANKDVTTTDSIVPPRLEFLAL